MDFFFFHALGVLCFFGLIACIAVLKANLKRSGYKWNLAAILAGILCALAAYAIFILVDIDTNLFIHDTLYRHTSIIGRLYIFSLAVSGLIFPVWLLVKRLLPAVINGKIVLCSAYIVNLLIIIQPLAYNWVKRLTA